MSQLFFVAFGGALGALARYFTSILTLRFSGGSALATLIVNTIGAFAALFLITAFADKMVQAPSLRLFAIVGFLGAFTTFSAFAYETIAMFENGLWTRAVLNIMLNNSLALLGGVLGIFAARSFA